MSATPYLAIAYIAASQNQKEVTANAAFEALDNAQNAELVVPITNAGLTLTRAQTQAAFFFDFTGALTAGANVILPASNRLLAVRNGTTGGESLTVFVSASPAGASVVIAGGVCLLLYCDGVNVYKVGN